MLRNFFLKTLYQKRFMALWWFIGIMAITVLTMSFYHTFTNTDISAAIKGLPPGLQKIAGDQASFKTIDGYIRQQIFALRLPLLTIILAISLLVGLTAGDESRGLLETQLSLPITRTSLLLQKLAAACVIVVIASCGALLGIALTLLFLHEHESAGLLLKYILDCATLALVYGLVGFVVAAVTGRRGMTLGIASGFAFLSYLVDSLAPAVSSLHAVDKLTFFYLYQNDPFSWGRYAGLLLVAALLILVSVAVFNRRDIRQN